MVKVECDFVKLPESWVVYLRQHILELIRTHSEWLPSELFSLYMVLIGLGYSEQVVDAPARIVMVGDKQLNAKHTDLVVDALVKLTAGLIDSFKTL